MQESSLYVTYDAYKKIPGNEAKLFNQYLLDYFKEKAVPWITKYIEERSQIGCLSRLTNDLPTIHPELSNAKFCDYYKMAINFMNDVEKQYRVDVFRRWVYASINIIAQLFIDKDGKIKDKFLQQMVGANYATLQEVKDALYGKPENQEIITATANVVIGSAAIGVSQILTEEHTLLSNQKYLERFGGIPDDKVTMNTLSQALTFASLGNYLEEDYYLCRIRLFQRFNAVLIDLNSSFPEGHKSVLAGDDLNLMYDRLVLWSPIAGTMDYNLFYNAYLNTYATIVDQLSEANPLYEPILKDIEKRFLKCISDLKDCPNRSQRMQEFSDSLKEIVDLIKEINQSKLAAA
jgi:hypothetical protein